MNLIPSFRDSLFKPMADPMMDIGEVFLDTVFEDGVLKEIPIIGTIAGLAKATVAIRERQLAKNTYAFIKGLREKNLSQEKLDAYRKKLDDPKVAERELGYVILLLDREIRAEKSLILGRMYAALVDQSISWEQFQELSEALDRMFMADFQVLARIRYETPLMTGVRKRELHGVERLWSLGLAISTADRSWDDVANGDRFVISDLGRLMMRFVGETK